MKARSYNLIFSLLAVLALWGAWAVSAFAIGNAYILPSLTDTAAELGRLLTDAAFWRAFGATLGRSLAAFGLSVLLSLPLALLSVFRPVRAFLAPVISVLRTVPTMAVVLMLLLWTSPAAAPVIIAVLVLFPALYAALMASLKEVHDTYGETAEIFHVKHSRQAFLMYLPLSAPPILEQTGSLLSLGLKITVSGEVLSVTAQSLGGMMQQAQGFLQMPRLFALTLVTIALGFLFEGMGVLLKKILRRML